MSQEDAEYNAQAEQVHLFERLNLCRELTRALCEELKNNELSQYCGDASTATVVKVRGIQWNWIVLAEQLHAAMENTKIPSNEDLAVTLEWVREQSQ